MPRYSSCFCSFSVLFYLFYPTVPLSFFPNFTNPLFSILFNIPLYIQIKCHFSLSFFLGMSKLRHWPELDRHKGWVAACLGHLLSSHDHWTVQLRYGQSTHQHQWNGQLLHVPWPLRKHWVSLQRIMENGVRIQVSFCLHSLYIELFFYCYNIV